MAKKKTTNQVQVGRDFEGTIVQGKNNTTTTIIQNEIDSEGINQGLQEVSEAIYDNSRQARWERLHFDHENQESREILDTIFVAVASGVAIGLFWKSAFPWNEVTVPFLVIATAILFNVIKLTHFGLRHSFVMISLIIGAYIMLLKYTIGIQSWMSINQFTGTAILSTIGAGFGLVIGIIQLFWKPLGD